jgi:hypothetical protein
MVKLPHFAVAILLSVSGIGAATAQPADATQRALVERYVSAVKSQDLGALKNVYDPASLRCITPDTDDYFNFIFAQELRYGAQLGNGYILTRFDPADSNSLAFSEMGGMSPNPVQPTHEFQIDTSFDSNNHSLTIQRLAVEHDGNWFIVLGCPTPKAVEFFRQRRADGEQQKARAEQLVTELREPLLSDLRALLASKRRIEAIKRYQATTDTDLTTATRVVELIESK